MSTVTVAAERTPHDLSRFNFSCGEIGRLKVIDCTHVLGGDSVDLEVNGAIRLSPLRRGLAVDSQVDIFSFYIPHRRTLGDEWINFVNAGPSSGINMSRKFVGTESWCSGFLGCLPSTDGYVPTWWHRAYFNIYNNYFKNPYDPDWSYDADLSTVPHGHLQNGWPVANLKNFWTAPLPPTTQISQSFATDPEGSIDIMALNRAYGSLHSQQERDFFATRYRDMVEQLGGSTSYDADDRPQLLMRTKLWASGYDVEGSDAGTLGQYAGRVSQTFRHSVPRFYVPEHGCIMTVQCVRFPPTHTKVMHPLVGLPTVNYSVIMGDPSVDGNAVPAQFDFSSLFRGGDERLSVKMPWGQWHRCGIDFVDERYEGLQGFPFLSHVPDSHNGVVHCIPQDYDSMFQTTQLFHWNSQAKVNAQVLRALPTAAQSILTSV